MAFFRFSADRQINDASNFCIQQEANTQDSKPTQQSRDECLKSRLDPNVYQWFESTLKK